MATSDPLLDALCVEDMLLITVQRRHKVVSQEVTPADGALSPEATHAFVEASLLFHLRLFVLELCLVQG